MRLIIDSGIHPPSNGKGPVDYTEHVADGSITIEDSVNVPTLLSFTLEPVRDTFSVPARSCYVKLVSEIFAEPSVAPNPPRSPLLQLADDIDTDGKVLFTGFITNAPQVSYVGLNPDLPSLGYLQNTYAYQCTSDEWLLNSQTVPFIPAFVNQTDSQILASIAEALMPGFFDTTSFVASGTLVPYYQYDPTQTWSDIAKTFADANRYWYKVKNRKFYYQPFGQTPSNINTTPGLGISYDETTQKEATFDPSNFQSTVVTVPPVNDCLVIGDTEPQTDWDNYFIGDGFTSNFQLKHQVFQGVSSQLLSDDWTESSFQTGMWVVNDPEGVLDLTDSNGNPIGALNVIQKGTHATYSPIEDATFVQAQNGLELGGGLNLQHGQFTFNDTASGGGGVVGGIFAESTIFDPNHCLAGFGISGQPHIGSFTVVSVTASGGLNEVLLTISGINTSLAPGNVFVCAGFSSATFLNGQFFYITAIQQLSGGYVLTCAAENPGFLPLAYGPTGDNGTITFNQDAVINTASGSAGIYIWPLFSGSVTGSPVVTQVNHQYVLQTWIGAQAPNRFTRPFTNLTRSSTFGAQNLASSGTISWIITDVNIGNYVVEEQDPLFGLFPAAPPPNVTKFFANAVNLPPFALYVLLSGLDLNLSINYTVLALPPQGFLTAESLTGTSGGNLPILPGNLSVAIPYQLGFGMINQTAQISQQGEAYALSFYTDTIPSVGCRIRFQSWAAGQSIARVRDLGAIAAEGKVSGDSGVRAAIMANLSPIPRTSAECEAAAGAAILDREYPQFQGSLTITTEPLAYQAQFQTGLYDYPHTGLFLYINAPSRGISFSGALGAPSGNNFFVNTTRIQVVEMRQEVLTVSIDYGPDLYLEKQLPSFLEREQNLLTPTQTVPAPNPITIAQVLNASLPTLQAAQVMDISNSLTGNFILVDLSGGTESNPFNNNGILTAIGATGCEVRYVDSGWGNAGQGRVGIFTVDQFTLPRTVRDQTFYLRGVNGGIFSRFSKALRVVYPLIPSAPGLVSANASTVVAALAGDVRDIYGLELRALSASGFSGDIFVQVPSTTNNPIQNISLFNRLSILGLFTATRSNVQVNTTSSVGQTQSFFEGDIVYITCPQDSSFTGFRALAQVGLGAGFQTIWYSDYGQTFPDAVGGGGGVFGEIGTIQLVSRNGFALLASGSLLNGVATLHTQSPHNLVQNQVAVVSAAFTSSGSPPVTPRTPTFIAPFSQPLNEGAVFSTTAVVTNVIDAQTFQYIIPNLTTAGGMTLTPLLGVVAGIPLNQSSNNFFIPGAPAGTILQRVVTAPSDLVIDLTQPDIQEALQLLESLTPGSRVGGLSLFFFNLTWDYSAPTTLPSFTVPQISGAFIDLEAQALNWTVIQGVPNGHRVETFDINTGESLNKYTIDHPDNPQTLKKSFMLAADWTSPRQIKITPFDALGDGIPTIIDWGGASGIPFVGSGLPVGQIGDIIRYDVNNDLFPTWDSVNYSQPFTAIISQIGAATTPTVIGVSAAGFQINPAGPGNAVVPPTLTRGPGSTLFFSATASTSTLLGYKACENGSNSLLPSRAFYRWSHGFQLNAIGAGTRYWHGMCCHNSGSTIGSNSATILNSTKLATDSPTSSLIGFRYSGGTDNTWQAVTVNAGIGITVQDTGVVVDTAYHLFEICTDITGTVIYFLIDRNLVATININLPPVTSANQSDCFLSLFWTGDNKNTATIISATSYNMMLSLK